MGQVVPRRRFLERRVWTDRGVGRFKGGLHAWYVFQSGMVQRRHLGVGRVKREQYELHVFSCDRIRSDTWRRSLDPLRSKQSGHVYSLTWIDIEESGPRRSKGCYSVLISTGA